MVCGDIGENGGSPPVAELPAAWIWTPGELEAPSDIGAEWTLEAPMPSPPSSASSSSTRTNFGGAPVVAASGWVLRLLCSWMIIVPCGVSSSKMSMLARGVPSMAEPSAIANGGARAISKVSQMMVQGCGSGATAAGAKEATAPGSTRIISEDVHTARADAVAGTSAHRCQPGPRRRGGRQQSNARL